MASAWTPEDHERTLKVKGIMEPYSELMPHLHGKKKSSNFEVGDRVGVKSKPILGAGIIRWMGAVEGFEEEWAGIELELPRGKTDGKIKNVQNFTCPALHGIYAPVSDIDSPQNIKDIAKSEPAVKKKACCAIL